MFTLAAEGRTNRKGMPNAGAGGVSGGTVELVRHTRTNSPVPGSGSAGEVDDLPGERQLVAMGAAQARRYLGRLAVEDAAEVGQLAGDVEAVEAVGDAVVGERVGAVHQLEVQVRGVGVAA